MFFTRLKKACNNKEISVSKLLRELKFSSSSVTYWKRKGTIPKGEKLVKIAEYLDVTVDYLTRGETGSTTNNYNETEKYPVTVRESGRLSEPQRAPYNSNGIENSSITGRELGRLEGRIEELEKKNAEYKEIIENLSNQLRNVTEKMTEQIEKISKR